MVDVKTPLTIKEMKWFVENYKVHTFKRTFGKFIAYLYCTISLRYKSNSR